jgi:hypothetical protein
MATAGTAERTVVRRRRNTIRSQGSCRLLVMISSEGRVPADVEASMLGSIGQQSLVQCYSFDGSRKRAEADAFARNQAFLCYTDVSRR